MKTINIICLIGTFFIMNNKIQAQDPSKVDDINTQVWDVFTKAFETSDVDLFGSIHSKNLIRVNGDNERIQNLEEYLDGYRHNWKNKTLKRTIHFRFLERINNGDAASERGIYKLTIHPNTEREESYYGKFHVFLRKENKVWKLLIDYDSSENNTIDEASYMNAKSMD